MTGAQDGSVRMFEWNRPQQLICFRQAGNARVTRLYFNSQGNKVHTHTNKNTWCVCFVYLERLCWSPCTPPAVWSCWWGGLPQSLAGQPDIVQPQTLPGELASRLLRHLPYHVCEHLQTKVPTCLLLCSRWQSWQCHTKTCGDFAFITSSSLIATAGQSNDNRSASVMSSTLILWCVRWY